MGKEAGSQKHFFLALIFLVGVLAVSSYFQSATTGDYIYPERGLRTINTQPQSSLAQQEPQAPANPFFGDSCGRIVGWWWSKVCISSNTGCGLYTCDSITCTCTNVPQPTAKKGEPCAYSISDWSPMPLGNTCSVQIRQCGEGTECDLHRTCTCV